MKLSRLKIVKIYRALEALVKDGSIKPLAFKYISKKIRELLKAEVDAVTEVEPKKRHAGGDEEHVRAFDRGADVGLGHLGGDAALLGLAAGTQAGLAKLDRAVRGGLVERLRVGVGADELDALHLAADHVIDRVAATTANTDHLDLGAPVELLDFNHLDAHVNTP